MAVASGQVEIDRVNEFYVENVRRLLDNTAVNTAVNTAAAAAGSTSPALSPSKPHTAEPPPPPLGRSLSPISSGQPADMPRTVPEPQGAAALTAAEMSEAEADTALRGRVADQRKSVELWKLLLSFADLNYT